jgi:DNA-binding CsgD family transcriptional regulator
MRPRTVVIVHRDAMVAEGLAAALSGYPELVPMPTTTIAESLRYGEVADAVALDAELPGAEVAAARLQRMGARVIFLGEPRIDRDSPDAEDEAVHVSMGVSVRSLASALVPGITTTRPVNGALTNREQEVLSLIARGLAAKQVAKHLGISPKTVERHKTRIYCKLGVPNQAAAVSVGLSNRLVGSAAWI